MRKFFVFRAYFLPVLFVWMEFVHSASSSPSASKPSSEYLDFAASWPANKAAMDEFLAVSKLLGNSSGISPHAEHLRKLEVAAAKVIAKKIHGSGVNLSDVFKRIHWVNSATVANNIAILGVALKNPGCHLITSKIEHKSVLNVFKELEKRGYKVTYLNVDSRGKIDLKQLQDSIRAHPNSTKLISVQMFNSEIGISQDMKAIGVIAKKHGILFHSDASQAFCKYPIDVDAMNVDLLTISGYKVGAPKGIAALYVRDASKLQPILFGSGDELCPGTRPTALICSFAKAVETFSYDMQHVRKNYEILRKDLLKIGGMHINSSEPSHVLSVSIEGVLLKDILEHMKAFSFSAGCSCLGQDKSNVIEAIDPKGKLPGCTLRISFSDKSSAESLKKFAKNLQKVVEDLRKEKNVGSGCEQDRSADSKTQKGLNQALDQILSKIESKIESRR